LLPKLSEVQKVKHHPAFPYVELPAFMQKLRQVEGPGGEILADVLNRVALFALAHASGDDRCGICPKRGPR
jgi:hypothetical protein